MRTDEAVALTGRAAKPLPSCPKRRRRVSKVVRSLSGGTGEQQLLVPGVRPLRLADRLLLLASAPLAPTKPQRAADFGLFDLNARNQLELFAARPTKEHNP
jgi:hypothetical protein